MKMKGRLKLFIDMVMESGIIWESNKEFVVEKETFTNENKFKEYNHSQKIDHESSEHINSIQNFLDTFFDCANTSYHLVTKEPQVIAKVILHFQKCGWTVQRKATNYSIQLDFSIDT